MNRPRLAAVGLALGLWVCAVSSISLGVLPAADRAHVAAAAAAVPISEKIRQKQAIIEATRRKLQASRKQLHVARFKEQTIADQLNTVQSSIARVRNNLDDLATSIDQNQRRLAVRRQQLAWARAS